MKREAIKKWIWEHMHESIADTIKALNVKLTGHIDTTESMGII